MFPALEMVKVSLATETSHLEAIKQATMDWSSQGCANDIAVHAGSVGPSTTGVPFVDFFTGGGHYMPRTHCLQTAQGGVDWPWVIALVCLSVCVVGLYLRIFTFWMRAYFEQAPRDRNSKLFELAMVFFLCAICGYAMSVVMFIWPAYRLLAILLIGLNLISIKFCFGLENFKSIFSASRFQREQRETLERQAREAEEARRLADQANISKSAFLANMSHEIRTPMTAILGFADLLDDGEGLKDATATANAVQTIRANANHLLTIINDILDMSKIEAGRMTIERIETSPAQILEQVASLMRPRATGKGINVKFVYDTAIPATIHSDPTRLRQILLNLVGNAIKFTEVGSVTVRVAYLNETNQIRFQVIDTGIGMSEEQRDFIARFEAFSQADDSTTRQFGGSGLGLRISNSLAELLGGKINIESQKEKGSVFTVTVGVGDLSSVELVEPEDMLLSPRPIKPKQATSSEAFPLLSGIKVLLAEDGPDNQRLISFHLKKAGADVTIADNGRIAVELIEADHNRFDVVLMDMQMPELDGYQATKKLRRSNYHKPIIALTAHAMDSDRQKCLDAGCNDYTTKPIHRESLLEMVASYGKSSSTFGYVPTIPMPMIDLITPSNS